MVRGPIKRLGQWAWVGLLLLPLAAFAASPTDSPEPQQLEPQQLEREKPPFTVSLQKQVTDDRVHYHLQVRADPLQVDIASTTVVAHSRSSAGFSSVRTLPRITAEYWRWSLSPDEPGRYRIDLEVSSKTPEGEPLRMALGSQYFQFPEPGDPYISPEERALAALAQGLEEDPELAPLPAPIIAIDEPSEAAPEAETDPPNQHATDAVNRVMLYGSILTVCLLALALVTFGYQTVINRRRAERSNVGHEKEEREPSAAPPPPMQDIGPEDDDGPDTDGAEPALDTRAESQSTLDAELALPPEVAPPETRADEPLFPLDDDDWASAEMEDSAKEKAFEPLETPPKPPESADNQ